MARIAANPDHVRMQPDPEPDVDERRLRLLVLAILGVVVLGGAFDLYMEAPDDLLSAHVLIELALMVTSATVGVVLWRAWRRTAEQLTVTRQSLEASQADRAAWRARAEQALHGLGQAIDEQFEAWGLTPSEREVALLLLKGYGHKQVAARTDRSERTVRQHAVSVYSKSGQGGRAELAAFFLEGLMLPQAADASAGDRDR
jgi:DNA-binding CsgD family transcriptional regulator